MYFRRRFEKRLSRATRPRTRHRAPPGSGARRSPSRARCPSTSSARFSARATRTTRPTTRPPARSSDPARRRLEPGGVPGLVLVRDALTPEAQSWLLRAIRAERLLDLDAEDDAGTLEAEAADSGASSGRPPRRNQSMRFAPLPAWASSSRAASATSPSVPRTRAAAAGPPSGPGPPSPPPPPSSRTPAASSARAACFPTRGPRARGLLPRARPRARAPVRPGRRQRVPPRGGPAPAPSTSTFADGVAVVSLESAVDMDMYPPRDDEPSKRDDERMSEQPSNEPVPVRLHPGDVLFLAGGSGGGGATASPRGPSTESRRRGGNGTRSRGAQDERHAARVREAFELTVPARATSGGPRVSPSDSRRVPPKSGVQSNIYNIIL